jgi:hypothetical protein
MNKPAMLMIDDEGPVWIDEQQNTIHTPVIAWAELPVTVR